MPLFNGLVPVKTLKSGSRFLKKLQTSFYDVVGSIFRYPTPFRRGSRVWRREERADILIANAALHYAAQPETMADYEHRALTFDPNKYGGVGGAERAGCDADVLAVVRQGDVFDRQSSSRLRLHVADDRRRRQVRLDAAERVATPPCHVWCRPTPTGAFQLQTIAFYQVHRLLHPAHHWSDWTPLSSSSTMHQRIRFQHHRENAHWRFNQCNFRGPFFREQFCSPEFSEVGVERPTSNIARRKGSHRPSQRTFCILERLLRFETRAP